MGLLIGKMELLITFNRERYQHEILTSYHQMKKLETFKTFISDTFGTP